MKRVVLGLSWCLNSDQHVRVWELMEQRQLNPDFNAGNRRKYLNTEKRNFKEDDKLPSHVSAALHFILTHVWTDTHFLEILSWSGSGEAVHPPLPAASSPPPILPSLLSHEESYALLSSFHLPLLFTLPLLLLLLLSSRPPPEYHPPSPPRLWREEGGVKGGNMDGVMEV